MKIQSKYLLLNSIGLVKDQQGRYLCDPFWAKDLKLHLDYISDLHLCCPVIEAKSDDDVDQLAKKVSYNFGGMADITEYPIKIVPLQYSDGWTGVLKGLLPNFFRVNRAITKETIVHTDGAGWPFPLSFYVLPIRWFKTFKWVMIIESTFWMVKKDAPFNPLKAFTQACHQWFLPRCLKAADARIFTHQEYKKMFFDGDAQTHVASYTNLDSEFLISEKDLIKKQAARSQLPLRCLFAARLVKEKGVMVLLDAIKRLSQLGVNVQIDLVGSGELEQTCREFAEKAYGTVEVSFVDPVAYGPAFFNFISGYDALIIANLTEEQPRIVFDAFGQGLAIIASDTDGLKTVTKHQENALLFKTGDADAMAKAIKEAAEHPEKIAAFGREGLKFAQSKTHQQMHKNRADFFAEVFAA